jgi:hypothetical protein
MNTHDATEQAYKRGYEDGKRDATKPGYWITKDGITFCSECMTCGLPHWKRCPVCEAKMGRRKED